MLLTVDLLTSIKRRANIPSASGVFGDTELLAMATEELRSYIVPLVLKEREDYWMTYADVPLTSATSYPVPARAVGGKLREVSILADSAGTREVNLPRVSPADLERAGTGFFMDNQGVRLWLRNGRPPSDLGVTLRLRYYLRPSALVPVTAAAVVSSLASFPAIGLSGGYATLTTPGTYDCVSVGSPFSVRQVGFAGSVAGATLTSSGAAVANFSAGDWICDADQSPVVQAPVEFHDVLAQKVAVKVAESKNQTERLTSMREELGRLEGDARALISPRVDGETQRAVNRSSLFRMRW